MPSLEIICINQSEPSDFSHFPFAVEAEKKLVSHRCPAPLFQNDFDKLEGCIYHLLDERRVTAYDLLKRDWYNDENDSNELDYNVELRDEYKPFMKDMLDNLLQSSPTGKILFTTDYQFGPEVIEKHGPMPFSEFWQLYKTGGVRMNASYIISAS